MTKPCQNPPLKKRLWRQMSPRGRESRHASGGKCGGLCNLLLRLVPFSGYSFFVPLTTQKAVGIGSETVACDNAAGGLVFTVCKKMIFSVLQAIKKEKRVCKHDYAREDVSKC